MNRLFVGQEESPISLLILSHLYYLHLLTAFSLFPYSICPLSLTVSIHQGCNYLPARASAAPPFIVRRLECKRRQEEEERNFKLN